MLAWFGVNLPIAQLPCRDAALAVDEPLAGSAATASVILALEFPAPWVKKVPKSVPAIVAEAFATLETGVPGLRPQLIRRGTALYGRSPALFLAILGDRPRVVRLHLGDYHALLDLDIPAVVRGELPARAVDLTDEAPLVLVCTHGKRDPCCAREGTALYQALSAEPGLEVWQTSHLGGHRFAATALCLQSGYCYGRLAAQDAPALADALRRGEVGPLDKIRGRMDLPAAAQAVDVHVRQDLAAVSAGATTTVAGEGRDDDPVVLTVAGKTVSATVSSTELAPRPGSCGKSPEPARAFRVHVLS